MGRRHSTRRKQAADLRVKPLAYARGAVPTVEAIIGAKVAPGLLDHYLARTGYESQQTDEPADPNRPNNLWEPVPGDHGAHGVFNDRASDHSLQLWADTHRGLLALLGFGLAGAAYAVFSRNGR